ncbi:MAG: MBL fold metallo-hydrolase [Syntrophobacterales bacterium]|nr:MBL fold metallo-hydrolase [Syntrophobacterales bacterium]
MPRRSHLAAGLWLLLFTFCTGFGPGVLAQEGLKKIRENVYSYADVKKMAPQNSFGANAGIVIGRDGIVVIDTLMSAKEAQRFLKDIRAVSDKPIKFVINTHYHGDHTFGNAEFARLGATIIGHEKDKAMAEKYNPASLKNMRQRGFTEADIAGTTLAYPALSFSDRMDIDLGDQKMQLIYHGPSHSVDSILVYLPDKKVLFTGDILFTNYHAYMADGDLKGWLKALDYILALDVETIIPGHGPISSKKDIREMKDYLVAFDKQAKELCNQSRDVEYITAALKKALPPRAEGEGIIKMNLEMKYLKKE